MKLKNCTVQELSDLGKKHRIFCFGASVMPQEICEEYAGYHFEDIFHYFVDNAPEKSGAIYMLLGKAVPVLSVNGIAENIKPGPDRKYYL